MINCADMILLEDDRIKGLPFSKIKYIPDFFLPKQFINFKKFLIDGNFKIAFQRRDGDTKDYVNSTDWRKAQIPSANGHGTSEALAKFYGILSTGCERNGYSLMSPDTLHAAFQPHSSGPDSVLFGSDITFGLGFELASKKLLKVNFAPRFMGSMFGLAGMGGAVGFGDVDK